MAKYQLIMEARVTIRNLENAEPSEQTLAKSKAIHTALTNWQVVWAKIRPTSTSGVSLITTYQLNIFFYCLSAMSFNDWLNKETWKCRVHVPDQT